MSAEMVYAPPPPATNEIATAIAKAQLEMKNPELDAINPHFKAKFASLPSVRNAIVPVFAKYGLAIVQDVTTSERGISCRTIVLHSSGQSMTFGPLEIPAAKNDAQGLGSAETYARRYALLAVACIAGDEDDDGAAATKSVEPISVDQATELRDLISETGADETKFLELLGVHSLDVLPKSAYGAAKVALKAKAKTRKEQ